MKTNDPNREVRERYEALTGSFKEFASQIFFSIKPYETEAEYDASFKALLLRVRGEQWVKENDGLCASAAETSSRGRLSSQMLFAVNLQNCMIRFHLTKALCSHIASWMKRQGLQDELVLFDVARMLAYCCGTEQTAAIEFLNGKNAADLERSLLQMRQLVERESDYPSL